MLNSCCAVKKKKMQNSLRGVYISLPRRSLQMLVILSHFELFCSRSFDCFLPAFYSHWFLTQTLFGAFAKLWKATISFVMSAHPSVRPSARLPTWNNSAPTGRILMKFDSWVVFEKLSQNSSFIKSDKNNGHFTRRPLEIFLSYVSHFFLEWKIFQMKVVEKIKRHLMFSNVFLKSCR